jgi:hypothetical protein
LKEIEMSLTKSNSDLEKKVNMLQNQMDRLEDEKLQMEDNYQVRIAILNN